MNRIVCLYMGVVSFFVGCSQKQDDIVEQREQLGKAIFFDEALSEPGGQSCATCHTPERGFADKDGRITSEGAVKGLFSNRNSITCAYSCYVPELYLDEEEGTYVGGLFWDGRVNTLEEQASQPFVNPLEMANADAGMVVEKAKRAAWYPDFVKLYGSTHSVDTIFFYITEALAAYERSAEMNPFSSKFDAYKEGKCKLTKQEKRGKKLFEEKGLCAECHTMEPDERCGRILFTDHTYDNLGIPYNTSGRDTTDLGLGSFLKDSLEYGKFRVPTLRNIALTAPYGHNGYFKTLEEIVHFYNVRDVESFPPAEYEATVNKDELGNLLLTAEEEADIVAFMKTLSDGYKLK